jgi:succinate-acetate transporter protein
VPALLSGEPVQRATAVGVQAVFAVLCLIFVALCVKSFIDTRKAATAR